MSSVLENDTDMKEYWKAVAALEQLYWNLEYYNMQRSFLAAKCLLAVSNAYFTKVRWR